MLSSAEWLLVLAVIMVVALPLSVAYLVGRGRAGDRVAIPAAAPSRSQEVPGSEHGLADRLRDAFDHIDQAVVIADGDGAEVFANAAAENLRDSRDGRVLVESAASEMLRAALGGRSGTQEVDLVGPPARTFAISAQPLDGPGGTGALVVVEDITMQKVTDTVRRDFVANISHELKSPIGAMGLLADLIHQEEDPEVISRLASRMVAEAERASRTVDDLLELASIEFAGQVDFSAVPACSLVTEALERIAPVANQARVEIRLVDEFAADIVCDRLQMVSAIYNLVDNAVKYSPTGSVVEVVIRPSSQPGRVEFAVADTGVGIPRRDQDRIFERFYRVDRARSRGTGGTGLGLAIVRHVANNHGGEVTVASTEGVGTTFTLTIAVAPPENGAVP